MIRFEVDGRLAEVEDPGDATALQIVRDVLGVTTVKDGCGQGDCGACAVLWDDHPALLCLRRGRHLDGARIVTAAGLPQTRRDLLTRSFVDQGGTQCGFCTPGLLVRGYALLNKGVPVDELKRGLKAHLCRCTGYQGVIDALGQAAAAWDSPELATPPRVAPPGGDHARYGGEITARGERPFTADLRPAGLLHGALRGTDHPRARVQAIDTTAARALPGVRAVITAQDVPGERWLGHLGNDWPVFVAVGEVTHSVGSILAAVAAEDRATARRAAALIDVDYEVLPPLTSPRAALSEGAPRVHPQRDNLISTTRIQRGAVSAALSGSAHVIRQRFTTQRVEHAYLEVESCLAEPRGHGLLLHTQGQGVHEDQRQVAAALGWPSSRVAVQLEPTGGAFGGKEDLTVQPHTALLAVITGRPVSLTLSREESFRLSTKRHPMELDYTVGCDAQGHITAARVRIVGDAGGYLSESAKVLERAAGHSCGPYRVPAVDIEARAVYTNNPASGAFRGFGANQASFAIEGMLDRLAHAVGVDAWDIRERNVLRPGDVYATGQVMDEGCGALPTLLTVRRAFKSHPRAGVACGIKNTGIGNGAPDVGRALIEVHEGGALTVHTGFTEMGQGLMTVCQQIVCHVLGVGRDRVTVKISTDKPVLCGMTTASRATLLAGEATRRAAEALRSAGPVEALAGREFLGEFISDDTDPPDTNKAHPRTHLTFGYAAQVVQLDEHGGVERVVAAHDVGHVMNPVGCRGQVVGGVHMGLGYALREDFPCDGGEPRFTRLRDLGVLRAHEMPPVEVHLVEVSDPHSGYGVKGVGEIGLLPTPGAVASALWRFDGQWRSALPMDDSPAALALSRQRR